MIIRKDLFKTPRNIRSHKYTHIGACQICRNSFYEKRRNFSNLSTWNETASGRSKGEAIYTLLLRLKILPDYTEIATSCPFSVLNQWKAVNNSFTCLIFMLSTFHSSFCFLDPPLKLVKKTSLFKKCPSARSVLKRYFQLAWSVTTSS